MLKRWFRGREIESNLEVNGLIAGANLVGVDAKAFAADDEKFVVETTPLTPTGIVMLERENESLIEQNALLETQNQIHMIKIGKLQGQINELQKKLRALSIQSPPKISLTDAILEIFEDHDKELNYKEVFRKVKKNQVRKGPSSTESLNSMLNWMVRNDFLRRGTKRGTFCRKV